MRLPRLLSSRRDFSPWLFLVLAVPLVACAIGGATTSAGIGGSTPTTSATIPTATAFPTAADKAYVLGSDGKLWLENGPWGTVPPARTQVDGSVAKFQPLDANTAYVLGTDGKLWLEHGPWGAVPPGRALVESNVAKFQALDANTVYVLAADNNSTLWREASPFGTIPNPQRVIQWQGLSQFQALDVNGTSSLYLLWPSGSLAVPAPGLFKTTGVYSGVAAFQALDAGTVYVVDTGGGLYLLQGTWGGYPTPARSQVDGTVAKFQALDTTTAYVEGTDGKLWLEHGPWGTVPPSRQQVDATVPKFQALDTTTAYVEDSAHNLWLEHGPWGTVPPARIQVDGSVADFVALATS
jgi:hypothetical protein